MNPDSIVVKYRTVRITVFKWSPRPGQEYWKFWHGKKSIVRADLDAAKAEAKRVAEETYLGAASIGRLTDAQTRAIRRMLDADPTLASVDDYLRWKEKQTPKHRLADARAEFLGAKTANAGASPHHVRTLTRHLSVLPNQILSEITLADLPILVGAPRSRKNRIDAWRSFFSWCRSRGYLPTGETIADKLEKPILTRTTPETWTPDELHELLRIVSPAYLPWLVLSAWAGMRTEEICPDQHSKKSPLLWSDFDWVRGIIIVRAETAKTGRRRIIPILPCVAELLPRDRVGRVGPQLPPHTPHKGGILSETTRLGKKMGGGWRRNALRHSYISYRAAIVGIAQAAMEAGNSESIARRAYEDAKGSDEAAAWFSLPKNYLSKSKSAVS